MNKLGRNKTLYLKKQGCVFKESDLDPTSTEIWTDHNEYVGLADLGEREDNINFIYKHRLTNLMSIDRALGKPLKKIVYYTALIGFSEKEQKWYGWSHRGFYSFGIGNIIFEGSVFDKYIKNEYIDYKFPFIIETLDEAKKFAAWFADYLQR